MFSSYKVMVLQKLFLKTYFKNPLKKLSSIHLKLGTYYVPYVIYLYTKFNFNATKLAPFTT